MAVWVFCCDGDYGFAAGRHGVLFQEKEMALMFQRDL